MGDTPGGKTQWLIGRVCDTQIGGLGVLDGIDMRGECGMHGLNDYRYLSFDARGHVVRPEVYYARNITTALRAPENADVLRKNQELLVLLEQLSRASTTDTAADDIRDRLYKALSDGYRTRSLPSPHLIPLPVPGASPSSGTARDRVRLAESLMLLYGHHDRRADGVCSVALYEAPVPPGARVPRLEDVVDL
jgi:hypothetical protein